MIAFTFVCIAAAVTAIACMGSSLAAPVVDARASNSTQPSSKPPHLIIYIDEYVTGITPNVSDVEEYCTTSCKPKIRASLLLSIRSGYSVVPPTKPWGLPNLPQTNELRSEVHIMLQALPLFFCIVSAFGATETATTSGMRS